MYSVFQWLCHGLGPRFAASNPWDRSWYASH
jgi:hypothetical protein